MWEPFDLFGFIDVPALFDLCLVEIGLCLALMVLVLEWEGFPPACSDDNDQRPA